MADPFDKPPKMTWELDEEGNIKINPQQFAELLRWLERFQVYVEANLP